MTVLLLIATFTAIASTYDHNESFYLTAGYLVSQGQSLYADFAFWQMPNSALIYGAVFWLSGTEDFVLTGKIVSFVFFWLAAIGAGFLAHRLSRNAWVAFGSGLILILNPIVLRCAAEASNYIMPIAFSVWAFYFFTLGWNGKSNAVWFLGLSGFMVNLAVGTKLYYATTILPYLAVLALWQDNESQPKRRKRRVAPFLIGAAIGIIPSLWHLIKDFDVFMFNNLKAHFLTREWYAGLIQETSSLSADLKLRLGLSQKLRHTFHDFVQPGNLAISAGLVAMAVYVAKRQAARSLVRTPLNALALILSLVALVSVLIPTPMWLQYVGTPLAFMAITLIVLISSTRQSMPKAANIALILVVGLQAIPAYKELAPHIRHAADQQRWASSSVQPLARMAGERVASRGGGKRLACWQQIFAVESKQFEPYPELVMAPFGLVIADRLNAEQRKKYRLVGLSGLDDYFQEEPPAAAFRGLYGNVLWSEAELSRWIKLNGFVKDESFPPIALELYLPAPAWSNKVE